MSKKMVKQTKKFNITPIASTLQQIALISPGIDDSSTLLNLEMSVTPKMMSSKKKA